MISFLFLLGRQSDPGLDIEQAIRGKKPGSPEFQRSVSDVFGRYGVTRGKFESKETVGDIRALVLTAIDLETKYPTVYRVFVWPEGQQNRAQLLRKTLLYSGDSFTEGEVYWRGDRMAIAGWQVNGGNAERAALASYRLVDGRWKMVQHLEDEREGWARFARNAKAVDPNRVVVTTREWTKHLEQPRVGPLLRFEASWAYGGGMYRRGPTSQVYTPLAELDRLAGYVAAKDRASFDARVPADYQVRLWEYLYRYRAVRSVNNSVLDTVNTFRFGDSGPVLQMGLIDGRWTPISWQS